VNHLRRFHSHQFHFTVDAQPPQLQQQRASSSSSSSSTAAAAATSAKATKTKNVKHNTDDNNNSVSAAIVVTAVPIVLQKKMGIDRRSDKRSQRTFYFFQSKLPIATGHHQRDGRSESINEWRMDLREKVRVQRVNEF
jgi:hypothetical protein